jgi:hypothetical protein
MTAALREDIQLSDIKAIESRADVDSLERLQDDRRKLLPRYAELAAKFKGGNSASADTKRKQERALVSQSILEDLRQKNAKVEGWKEPSEAALERMAMADPRYINFVNAIDRDFTEYVLLDYKIQEIQEKIRSRETELMCYNAELRLQR